MAFLLNPLFDHSLDIYPRLRPELTLIPRRRRLQHFPAAFDFLDDLPLLQSNDVPPQVSRDNEKSFDSYLQLDGYDPKDVEVQVDPNNRMVTVSGTKKEEGTNCSIQRRFQKSFQLPEDCSIQNVKSVIDKNGILHLTSPKEEAKAIEGNPNVKQVKVGKEVVEVEDVPEESAEKPVEKKPKNEVKGEVIKVPVEVEVNEDKMEVEEAKEDDKKPFEVKVDIEGFSPDDVKVNLNQKNGVLSVKAGRKIEKDNGMNFFSHFVQNFYVDTDLYNVADLKCDMTDKVLTISAPRLDKPLEQGNRNIPITFKK